MRTPLRALVVIGVWIGCCWMGGCKKQAQRQVVIYTSEDQPVAEPILREFERQTGVHVVVVTDTEASKSVGLAERLIAEKDHPQADVWWSNEAFRTIDLGSQGVLAAYDSPSARDIPARFKDAEHLWAGAGIRARVLAVWNGVPSNVGAPKGLADLTRPEFKGKIVMARPTAGTTGSFVAALYVLWGDQKADAFFHGLRDNGILLVGGNSVVADAVGRGQFWAGMTDNDDVLAAQANELKLHLVLPDQDGVGTLAIPGSVALVAGAKHPAEARQLIDFLLSPRIEQELIAAHSAAWSVRDRSPKVRFMDVDFKRVAGAMRKGILQSVAILEGR